MCQAELNIIRYENLYIDTDRKTHDFDQEAAYRNELYSNLFGTVHLIWFCYLVQCNTNRIQTEL